VRKEFRGIIGSLSAGIGFGIMISNRGAYLEWLDWYFNAPMPLEYIAFLIGATSFILGLTIVLYEVIGRD
jgi:hypothetical protein